jgi:hypothetical protein
MRGRAACARRRARDQPYAGAVTIRARSIVAIVIALCVVFLITSSVLYLSRSTAAGEPTPSSPAPAPANPVAPVPVAPVPVGEIGSTPASTLLASLPVKPALTMTGYNRTGEFGTAWLDEDRNGCDTRNDILGRDLTDATRSGVCKVLTGILVSPYTGLTIHFVRGEKTSALVQIDHLVALGDAWETGAQSLTQDQRVRLANDPLELMAVDGRSNDEKSDKDASEWLPPDAAFDCIYVARQISVKVTYSLWVTQAEHDAMARVLSHCGPIDGTASTLAVG